MSVTIPRSRSNCDRQESPRALDSRDSLRASLAHYVRSLSAYFVGVRRERGPFQSHPRSLFGQRTRAGLKVAGQSVPPGRSKHRSEARSATSPGAVERPGAFLPMAVSAIVPDVTLLNASRASIAQETKA